MCSLSLIALKHFFIKLFDLPSQYVKVRILVGHLRGRERILFFVFIKQANKQLIIAACFHWQTSTAHFKKEKKGRVIAAC